jgi:hypothetical protein
MSMLDLNYKTMYSGDFMFCLEELVVVINVG